MPRPPPRPRLRPATLTQPPPASSPRCPRISFRPIFILRASFPLNRPSQGQPAAESAFFFFLILI